MKDEIVTVIEDWNQRKIYAIRPSDGAKIFLREIPEEIPFPYGKTTRTKSELEARELINQTNWGVSKITKKKVQP